jgi:hypothetical protein
MFANSSGSLAKRRGIVLVVVLGMLGLMALIGVTFATFAGQSLIASRNFNQGVGRPQSEALMDYALAQLINDTNNPLSAIRGHGLLRDMYGNDSVFRGANPPANPSSETGGLLASVFIPGTGPGTGTQGLFFTKYLPQLSNPNTGSTTAFYNQYQYQTNIPTNGQYYGLDFTRWLVRMTVGGVPQTFEVLEDDASGAVHLFTLASNLVNPTQDPTSTSNPLPFTSGDWTAFIYADPNLGATVGSGSIAKGFTSLAKDYTSNAFVLDGRYMRAFNGSGMSATANRFVSGASIDIYPFNFAAYGNFRLNGIDPDSFGMDEDYDACDLENWFLAIQSADGQVVVPSFHRPGILTGPSFAAVNDWTLNSRQIPANNPGPYGNRKILRPRQIDNSPLFPADPSLPDPATGKLTYDIDNDGDGVTDSVWLDLGYSVQRDPGGKLYKPLFAFMVLGTNGRLPLNTVGNLQARAIGDQTNTLSATATVPGGQTSTNSATTGVTGPTALNGTIPAPGVANATTQVPYPGFYTPTGAPDTSYFVPQFSSQAYLDSPLWDHTSHLGFSVNEINPKFALQNAPSNLYPSGNGSVFGVYPAYAAGVPTTSYTQYDNVGMSVALTQLRNILAGTVPTDAGTITTSNLTAAGKVNISTLPSTTSNFDLNVVFVNGQPYILPNNVADVGDTSSGAAQGIGRNNPAVAGRWGEPQGIPLFLPFTSLNPIYSQSPISYPGYWYNNMVRAGRSYYPGLTNDAMDDDFDGFDPNLATAAEIPSGTFNGGSAYSLIPGPSTTTASGFSATQWQIPLSSTYTGSATYFRNAPEFVDLFDPAGQMAVPSERIRRFTTPIDPSGAGRKVAFPNFSSTTASQSLSPVSDNDFGKGYDSKGRVGYYRYFRPAGMPQEVRYPYPATVGTTTFTYPYPYATSSGLDQQFLMPVLVPAGYSNTTTIIPPATTPGPASKSDTHNNHYSGFQAALTPNALVSITPATSAASITDTYDVGSYAAMPYDWDMYTNTGSGGPPQGYGYTYDPTMTYIQKVGSVNLLVPTMNPNSPLQSTANNGFYNNNTNTFMTGWGPLIFQPSPALSPAPTVVQGYPTGVVNGYPGGGYFSIATNSFIPVGGSSLNVDEADEMNLYSPSLFDQPYGPSDLEWLYRLQDVDGSTLVSRLSKLAPVSFLNPADGPTRRRLFSTDSWDLNRFAYANDNPQGAFPYNSRFMPNASPSLEIMNQVVVTGGTTNTSYANPFTTEFLPNPTFPPTSNNNNIQAFIANASQIGTPTAFPLALTPQASGLFNNAIATAIAPNGVVQPFGNPSTFQVQTPSIAHGDRRINLNFPLPISNDPAEPIRQKWCRETYQLLKAILPPSSIDTPEELAALSQFVVNIIDFRDTDCTMTRFVNTDLEVTDVLTKNATNAQIPASGTYDLTWSVSPAGVRFATDTLPGSHFPYDPSIYSPDAVTPFLVQHGMENNPIALNEVMGYQAYTGATGTTPYQTLLIELVNTLTEELNNGATTNASAISLAGWDIVLTPDDFGWGRPDPISGDVNQIAWPPYVPNPPPPTGTGDPTMAPLASQRPNSTTTDTNLQNLQASVQEFSIPTGSTVTALGPPPFTNTNPNPYIIGDYRTGVIPPSPGNPGNPGTQVPDSTTVENPPVATTAGATPQLNLRLPPAKFNIPVPPAGKGRYYWVYLRRPANPFDTAPPNQVRPNKEMVVVDCMRFPVIDAGMPTGAPAKSPNQVFSSQRYQPYRGGHLIRNNTTPPSGLPTTGPAQNVTTICPPSPPYAYGYSEQTLAPDNSGTATSAINTARVVTSWPFKDSINATNANTDAAWCHMPINDRDFTSVAELLLVPNCPPGLFTKQFVEEQYPGNIFSNSATPAATATGTDVIDLTTTNLAYATTPGGTTAKTTGFLFRTPNPSLWGRQNFNVTTANLPATPTFPYLSDNFYYTAASVTPPSTNGTTLDPNYLALTTEIGGWTGAGWHKMLEFFEVPSSANGAIGTSDGGNNYDWARSDIKPGLINLNLIIDEEVFAGLIDDPRLNENLAYTTSSIPAVVNQIDGNGYPMWDMNPANTTFGQVYGAQPMFTALSVNPYWSTTVGSLNYPNVPAGRGYSVRDSNVLNYPSNITSPNYIPQQQQLHGMKAAFADFLKLRHGGSGYLYAFGNGPTGSGDYPVANLPNTIDAALYPAVRPGLPQLPVPLSQPTQPVAAERPYRSLSFPDINYTVMRPASLPPSPVVTTNAGMTIVTPGTTPPLPVTGGTIATYISNPPISGSTINGAGLEFLSVYAPIPTPSAGSAFPYVQLQPFLAPMNQGPPRNTAATMTIPYQYVYDPGLKNPFLPIQFANVVAGTPMTAPNPLAPPYATPAYPPSTLAPSPVIPAPAPFPPPIPPTPALRLFQVPDHKGKGTYSSNASVGGQADLTVQGTLSSTVTTTINGGLNNMSMPTNPTDAQLATQYTINQQVVTQQLSTGIGTANTNLASSNWITGATTLINPILLPTPPHLVAGARSFFLPDNFTPTFASTAAATAAGVATVPGSPAFNHLGSGVGNVPTAPTDDRRQHPSYRTEMLQKVMNLTTVRTHQFAVWITIGFFEVVNPGTPELGIPDVLGQELGLAAGKSVRYRSFFVLDRTKATGFNPYYPGDFRTCVTYRRRIE